MPTKVKMPSKPVGTASSSGPATNSPEAEAAGDEAASLIESGDDYEAAEDAEFDAFESEEVEPDLGESSTVGEQQTADESEAEPQPAAEGLVALDDLFGDESGEAAGEKPADAKIEVAASLGGDETDGILDELAHAEEECAAAELVVDSLKRQLKVAKEDYDEKVDELRRLARGVGKDKDRPLFDRPKTSSNTQPATAADVSESQPAAPQSTAWRSRSIAELDLGDALSERLENAGLSTIGQLEDHRAEIALGREKWPKGIGAAKITKIEDAVIAWLGKNRDAGLLGGDTSSVPVTPVDETKDVHPETGRPIPETGYPDSETTADTADGIPGSDDPTDVVAEDESTSDEDAAAYAEAWDELHEKAERTVNLQATAPEFESRFGQGMADFQNGESHYACPAEDADGQWNWMMGFVLAERQAAKEAFESEGVTDPLADLADL